MKCHVCSNSFLATSSQSKYCSRKCKNVVRKKLTRENNRKKINYYNKRIDVLRKNGYIVIHKDNVSDFINKFFQSSNEPKAGGSLLGQMGRMA